MELPIQDKAGKILGKVILLDEVEEVLKTTGVELMFNYDPKQPEFVVGYLH